MTVTQHQFTCGQCQAAFATSKPWQRFCSPRCRVAAHRARRAAPPVADEPGRGEGPVTRFAAEAAPEWRHNDQQAALRLLTAHLGYASQARAALAIIEQIADPCVTTLEGWVRQQAERKAIRPLIEPGTSDLT
jgi:hypothetical protein